MLAHLGVDELVDAFNRRRLGHGHGGKAREEQHDQDLIAHYILPGHNISELSTIGGNMASVKPIPDGYHTVTPYLYINGAASAIEFYKKAFNAEEIMRHPGPGGKVMHAEIRIGDSIVMLADEFPEMGVKSPQAYGGSPCSLCLYVSDVDARFNQ